MNTTDNTTTAAIETARSHARRARFVINAALIKADQLLAAERKMGKELDEIISIVDTMVPFDYPTRIDLTALRCGAEVFPIRGIITPEPVAEIIDEEPIAVNVSWLRRAVSIFTK